VTPRVHDAGKIDTNDLVLQKPGPLTDEEQKEMRRHTEIGHRLHPGRGRLRRDDHRPPLPLAWDMVRTAREPGGGSNVIHFPPRRPYRKGLSEEPRGAARIEPASTPASAIMTSRRALP